MKTKNGMFVAVIAALALGYAGVQATAQDTPSQRGTTQRGTESGAESGSTQRGGRALPPTQTTGGSGEQARPAVQQPSGPARIGLRDVAPFGQILVDANGRSLYVFSADAEMRSACRDECLEQWHPLLTQGNPTVTGRGLQSRMLGTIEREDGMMQVTYNQKPLYTFVQDRRAGEARGQRIRGHGGEWFLIGADGNQIERRVEETPSATPGSTRGSSGSTREPASGSSGSMREPASGSQPAR